MGSGSIIPNMDMYGIRMLDQIFVHTAQWGIGNGPMNMIGYGSEKPLIREQTERNFIRDANRSKQGQFFTGYLLVNLDGDVMGRAAIGGGYSRCAEAIALEGHYEPAAAETQMGVMIDRKHYSD